MPPASSPLTDPLAAHAMAFAADVREADRTAFLALLFAPEPARPALTALAAYRGELARIAARAGGQGAEPLAAEIRLQWWRDAIRGEGYGDVSGVPLVDALRAGMTRYRWPAATLAAISEAHIFDLYADPFDTADAFDGYAGEVDGALIQLGAMALGVESEGEEAGLAAARTAATAAGYAGVVLTAARAVETFAQRLARGQTLVPASLWPGGGEALKAALSEGHVSREAEAAALSAVAAHGRAAFAELAALMPTIAPVTRAALVRAVAAAATLEEAGKARPVRAPGPLVSQWRLWRAARRLNAAR